ncbi:leucine-rich repeat domain-containing protein [Chryseobacterium oranimense]|uniref:leucine-rich repeat domain-containing protein n=1 Tax=Chryseobacterium oranimense TaxID=421058 RepID=UPI0021AE7313|nr:leucine-rich repeat domain-containing protein [Chryseobacterium oranimense]UWX60887.1 leucine-rich repeat domain-containing protein [Chryseobacterium oranimense]
MMKIKIFATLSLVISGFSLFCAQKLNFKDQNFEKAVLENFDVNKNGSLEKLEADMVTNLFLVQKGITSADDILLFSNAKMIVLDDNTISNVSVKSLPNLELFSCTGCKIASFKAESLKNLASLYLDNNLLEAISLKETPRIDQLTLSLNQLKTIDITPLKNLRKLNIEHNKIQKLDISGNPGLQTLNVGGNPMKEADIKKGTKTDIAIFGSEQ